jgi:vancomycin resistance protein VanJ
MRFFARSFVFACAIAAVALSIAFRYGAMERPWVEIARYLPYPVYLAPAVVAVMLSWALGRAWQWMSLATFALISTQVMGLAVGRAESGSGRFKLMTYNVKSYLAVRHVDGLARLAWEIARHDPDVLVMQDAQALTPPHAIPASFQAALPGREVYRDGQYMVASRYPIRDCRPMEMPPANQNEAFLHCTLEIHGRQVALFTAHFVSPRDGSLASGPRHLDDLASWKDNLADRLSQAQAVATAVKEVPGRVVLAGDLNAEEDSTVVRLLMDAGLRDAFSSTAVGYGYTYGHALLGASFLRIDHILFGGGIHARNCEVGASEASEHRPVIAELSVDTD